MPTRARQLAAGARRRCVGIAALSRHRLAELTASPAAAAAARRRLSPCSSPTGSSRPADHGTWLRRDVPHLPIVLGDGAAHDRARSSSRAADRACTACDLDAQRCRPGLAGDRQPAAGVAPHPSSTRVLSPRSSRSRRGASANVSPEVRDRCRAADASSWRLDAADGSRHRASRTRHPECSCAAPQGSDWAPAVDPAAPSLRPGRERADAAPA